jgi:hypothetical protein
MSPLPIVVCGKILGIIEAVKEGLLPEYEGNYTHPIG